MQRIHTSGFDPSDKRQSHGLSEERGCAHKSILHDLVQDEDGKF